MKFHKYLACTLYILAISGCIPSLHGIYNEENVLIEDRIIGEWIGMDKDGIQLTSIDISIKTDDPDEQSNIPELKKDLEDTFRKKLLQMDNASIWTFERAGKIKWSLEVEGGSSTISMDPASPSLIEKGTIIENIPYNFYILTVYEGQELEPERMIVHLVEINGSIYMDFYPYTLEKDNIKRFGINMIPGHTFAKLEVTDDRLEIHPFDGTFIEKLIKEKRIRLKHELLDGEQVVLTASTKELIAFIEKYGEDERLYDNPEFLSSK